MNYSKIFSSLIILALTGVSAFALDEAVAFRMETTVTNMATATTNSTPSTIYMLNRGQRQGRLYLSFQGNPGTGAGSATVKLATASGYGTAVTNRFDTGADSAIKVTIDNARDAINFTNYVVKSDWFNLGGVKFIRVAQLENTFAGSISNINVHLSTCD